MIKLAILTVNYNKSDTTISLLESLEKLQFKDSIFFIVDNCSAKEDIDKLETRLKQSELNTRLIKNTKNGGWGNAMNVGFDIINSEKIPYTLVINNDAYPKEGTIERMLNFLITHKNVGICAPKILKEDGSIQTVGGRMDNLVKYFGITRENSAARILTEDHILNSNETIDDCSWMLRSEIMQKIKYPEYIFVYFEEFYINKMARDFGYDLAYIPKAEVVHRGGFVGQSKGEIQTFYLNRNRIIFIKDSYPMAFPIFLLGCILFTVPLLLLKYLAKRDFIAAKQIIRGTLSGLSYSLFKKITYYQ